jgi:hypothetical protein
LREACKFPVDFGSGGGFVSKALQFDLLKLQATAGELLLNRIAPENYFGKMPA